MLNFRKLKIKKPRRNDRAKLKRTHERVACENQAIYADRGDIINLPSTKTTPVLPHKSQVHRE